MAESSLVLPAAEALFRDATGGRARRFLRQEEHERLVWGGGAAIPRRQEFSRRVAIRPSVHQFLQEAEVGGRHGAYLPGTLSARTDSRKAGRQRRRGQ